VSFIRCLAFSQAARFSAALDTHLHESQLGMNLDYARRDRACLSVLYRRAPAALATLQAQQIHPFPCPIFESTCLNAALTVI